MLPASPDLFLAGRDLLLARVWSENSRPSMLPGTSGSIPDLARNGSPYEKCFQTLEIRFQALEISRPAEPRCQPPARICVSPAEICVLAINRSRTPAPTRVQASQPCSQPLPGYGYRKPRRLLWPESRFQAAEIPALSKAGRFLPLESRFPPLDPRVLPARTSFLPLLIRRPAADPPFQAKDPRIHRAASRGDPMATRVLQPAAPIQRADPPFPPAARRSHNALARAVPTAGPPTPPHPSPVRCRSCPCRHTP